MKWLKDFIKSITSPSREIELEAKLLRAAGDIDLLNLQIGMKNNAIKKLREELVNARWAAPRYDHDYQHGWLVVFRHIGTPPQYAHLVAYQGSVAWLQDYNRATRFMRKVDALNALEFLRVNGMAQSNGYDSEPYSVEQFAFVTQSEPNGNPAETATVSKMNPGLYPQKHQDTGLDSAEVQSRRWSDDQGKPVFGVLYPGQRG